MPVIGDDARFIFLNVPKIASGEDSRNARGRAGARPRNDERKTVRPRQKQGLFEVVGSQAGAPPPPPPPPEIEEAVPVAAVDETPVREPPDWATA
jgi:hypothetical protein